RLSWRQRRRLRDGRERQRRSARPSPEHSVLDVSPERDMRSVSIDEAEGRDGPPPYVTSTSGGSYVT
ncbi:hypothetical protein KIPB_016538, partial [Kipferlia bialata]